MSFNININTQMYGKLRFTKNLQYTHKDSLTKGDMLYVFTTIIMYIMYLDFNKYLEAEYR